MYNKHHSGQPHLLQDFNTMLIATGVVDTGVDYRHPALGGGFGQGYKIAGGWAFVADDGTTISSADPLTTCYGGGHGTHVAGN